MASPFETRAAGALLRMRVWICIALAVTVLTGYDMNRIIFSSRAILPP